jgi:hypothetical protein
VLLIDATIASRGPIRCGFSLARHEYRRSAGRRHYCAVEESEAVRGRKKKKRGVSKSLHDDTI